MIRKQVLGYGSVFGNNWIGAYKIHAIFDKEAYKLSTVPKDGKRAGVLKNPVNWSRLRKFIPQNDDEFFDPDVNVLSDLEEFGRIIKNLFVDSNECFIWKRGF